jgi:LPXTG-motif cell wall-anchored protein
MKNMRKITTLLLALLTVLMMSQAALAETQSVDGGTFTFNGSAITNGAAAGSGVDAALAGLEPGDTITFRYEYVNEDEESESTEWYLSNQIIKTLEEADAAGGGYSYKLINHSSANGDVTLFDSDAVGGEDKSIDEGLLQVNKAITGDGDEEFFHIDTLENGDSGWTEIVVALEGESQPNAYELKSGDISVAYAVEKVQGEEETIYKHVKTGDSTNILLPIAVFATALLLLILAILSIRRDRKDGEEA